MLLSYKIYDILPTKVRDILCFCLMTAFVSAA